jgi:very-short-patch-repair endonuclease/DNA polymerase III psi subunit
VHTRNKIKQVQNTEEYKIKQSNSAKRAWNSEQRKYGASLQSKKLWNNPEYKHSQIKSQKIKWGDTKYKDEQVLKRKNLEYRNKISITTKKALLDPELRKRMSALSKKRWEDQSYREKLGKARAEWKDGKISRLEKITGEILLSLGIKFISQYPIDHYIFDIFIPSNNLLIEVQGEYWHSLEKMKKSDASKFRKIDEYYPDLRILYLFERDFLNPEIIKEKIKSSLTTKKHEEVHTDFDFKHVKILVLNPCKKIPKSSISEVEKFLGSFHYAAYGRSAKIVYGAFLNNKLIAVCKFTTVVRKEVATSMQLKTSQVLELDRFCIHPNYHKKNFASWLLSKCSNLIFQANEHISCLVAFSDKTYDHTGIMYKASNWKKIRTVRPDYHYISTDGFVIHKKTLYNHAKKMSMKESEYANKFQYIKSFGKEKIKFIMMRVV